MRRHPHLVKLAEEGWRYRDWYAYARADILSVCTAQGWDFGRFVDILAITSPRMAVTRNVKVTLLYLQEQELPRDVTRSTRKALLHYEMTGEIRGPKTAAFAACLRSTDTDAVVLDTWMARALEVEHKQWGTKRGYAKGVERVQQAARKLLILPMECQAAVWAAAVKRAGRNVPSLRVSDHLTLY